MSSVALELLGNFQARIDACHEAGGGEVLIPPGRHLTGCLMLRSNVHLRLAPGAVLVGTPDIADYHRKNVPLFTDAVGGERGHALVLANDACNIGISGPGVLDGNGLAFVGQQHRPMLLRFVRCQGVKVRDVCLKDSAAWVQHYLDCEDVLIDGVTVNSLHCSNNDGINLDGCRRVTVSNCRIESKDDGITLKTTTLAACRDIVITNCSISSECNGIKIGTESKSAFRNISVTNCVLHGVRLCGIEILSVDGAEIDTVNVSNVTMDRVGGAFFVRLGCRGLNETLHHPGRVRNVSITNVVATIFDDMPEEISPWEVAHGARSPSSIMGLPGHPVEKVYLANISIHHIGTGLEEDCVRPVEEKPAEYPQWERWGPLPAWGIYLRHTRRVIGRDLQFSLQNADARPWLHAEDAEDLVLEGTHVYDENGRENRKGQSHNL
ncbi:MAG: right-handed parallel beta-helix repeat-containing protein [Chthoniobacterales bacterium]|nr:right-handed parallel beta-helix repeat-containing protein [Chthoniobacterales bacterium]